MSPISNKHIAFKYFQMLHKAEPVSMKYPKCLKFKGYKIQGL